MDLKEFTSYLHKHIPITARLGAKVESYDGNAVCISAPLRPNVNHRNTVFGGSISALAILSGWAMLHLKLRGEGIKTRLVIQKTSCDFLEPVDDDFTAICAMPQGDVWRKFIQTLRKHGKARIKVRSTIESSSGIRGTHEGVYVALKESEFA